MPVTLPLPHYTAHKAYVYLYGKHRKGPNISVPSSPVQDTKLILLLRQRGASSAPDVRRGCGGARRQFFHQPVRVGSPPSDRPSPCCTRLEAVPMLKSEGRALQPALRAYCAYLPRRQQMPEGRGTPCPARQIPRSVPGTSSPARPGGRGPGLCSPAWETEHTSFPPQCLLRLYGEVGLSWTEVKLTPICGNSHVIILRFRFILSLNHLDCHHFIAIKENKSSCLKSPLLPLTEMFLVQRNHLRLNEIFSKQWITRKSKAANFNKNALSFRLSSTAPGINPRKCKFRCIG